MEKRPHSTVLLIFPSTSAVFRSDSDRRILEGKLGSVTRFLRSAYYGALIGLDYRISLRGLTEKDAAYEEETKKVNTEQREKKWDKLEK